MSEKTPCSEIVPIYVLPGAIIGEADRNRILFSVLNGVGSIEIGKVLFLAQIALSRVSRARIFCTERTSTCACQLRFS